jgi:HAD superfamily, subfamily IIIB (Acid phosphatase)
MRGAAVFDVDGVLADVAHRRHHLAHRDWDAFFAAAADDPPLATGVGMAHECADAGLAVVYLSGRPERLRAVTSEWLDRHGLPPGELLLRPDDDRSPATRLKLRLLRSLAARGDVVTLVDDDSWVVDAVRAARPPLVTGQVFLADWQPGDVDGRRVLRRAQQAEGRT